jgi:hypothetical protein
VDAADFNKKRKRIWYSVYVTDRWCCAIMGRPLAIADSDCDVKLSLTDTLYPNEDLTTFFSFVKLSEILGDVLSHVYSARAKAQGYLTKAMEQTVWGLQRMLEQWYANVPDMYKITEIDMQNLTLNPTLFADTPKLTQGGPLIVCYYAIIVLLHRPFIVLEKDAPHMPFIANSVATCIQAAKLCVNIAQMIPSDSLVTFGWNSACKFIKKKEREQNDLPALLCRLFCICCGFDTCLQLCKHQSHCRKRGKGTPTYIQRYYSRPYHEECANW